MKPIQIRNRIYQPQKGDYITQISDGNYFFYAGDGRHLALGKIRRSAFILLTKKAVKEIEFEKLSFSTRGDRKYWFYV